MDDKKRPPLLIREEYVGIFGNLSNEQKGLLLTALTEYQWDGVLPNLPDKLSGVFIALKAFLDRDNKKYVDKCLKYKANAEARRNEK